MAAMPKIQALQAREILDSRGNPTVSVRVDLHGGASGCAQVPSGASTGRHEAVELRDGDPGRYAGKGVLRAVRNVEQLIGPAVIGEELHDQSDLDQRMITLDGTPDKSNLGANAMLGVSCAYARAMSVAEGKPLWASLRAGAVPSMPVPMVNILSGGLHAGGLIEIQDFLVIPRGFASFSASLEAIVAVHRNTRHVIVERGYALTGVADEGGWGPAFGTNEAALEILAEAIERSGYAGRMVIAIDMAASHFFEDDAYHLRSEKLRLNRAQMIDLMAGWAERYPVVSIEDGLEEDDWQGWVELTRRLGANVQLIGDDLFTTNPERVLRGIALQAGNAVLVKMNQIGTLTETFEVLKLAREAGYRAVISARSGETEDSFLADLAVASGAGQIKVGSITRSERLAKYNRLLEIEARELGYAGFTAR